MSGIDTKLKELQQLGIYKESIKFKKYINDHGITEADEKILYKSWDVFKRAKANLYISSQDNLIIDKALEITRVDDSEDREPIVDEVEQTSEVVSKTSFKDSAKDNKSNFENLEFRGDTIEYFKIWIVNIFLTVVTVGIYSAWAKVRTNRYFYANIFYRDSSFEYTADPISILKGRVIILAIYIIFILSSQVFLNLYITFGIIALVLLIMPWIINRAIKFKMRNIRHRNINFYYSENAPLFYKFFFIHLILNLITLSLAYPYSLNQFKKLLIDKTQFGTAKFEYSGSNGGMYMRHIKVLGIQIALFVILACIVALVVVVSAGFLPDLSNLVFLLPMLSPVILVFFIVIGLVVKGAYDAYVLNFVYNNTTLDQNITLKSDLESVKLAGIYVSNMFAIIISLGLLAPWAKVRLTRYRCKCFAICAADISGFIATEHSRQSALGEETEEFFDIDIGF